MALGVDNTANITNWKFNRAQLASSVLSDVRGMEQLELFMAVN